MSEARGEQPSGPGDRPDGAASRKVATGALSRLRHELRTPLNAVIGYSEMLLEEAQEDGGPEGFAAPISRIRDLGQAVLQAVQDEMQPEHLPDGAADPECLLPALSARAEGDLHEVLAICAVLLGRSAWGSQEVHRIDEGARRLLGMLGEAAIPTDGGPESPLDSQPPAAAAPSSGHTVLVVDDQAVNRELVARRLEREGHQAVLASGGAEALELLRAGDFDLVLLDVMMPGIDGTEVLRRMKLDPQLQHIPVLMISSLTELDSVVRCIELGAEDYLAKPFNPVFLRARIAACLDKKRLRDREVLHLQRIEEERNRADSLLRVILPEPIVEELKSTDRVRPRLYQDVAVLFCDIVGFTPYCERSEPEELIGHLQRLVESFEDLSIRHQMQKIKTIGDSFMATAGLLQQVENPVHSCVRCGLEMLERVRDLPTEWEARIGIHLGPVVAGVIGRRQYLYDLWGDTVNTAARVEAHGAAGAVNLSETAWVRVSALCTARSLGPVELKGKGLMQLYRVIP